MIRQGGKIYKEDTKMTYDNVQKAPVGWGGKTLKQMLQASEGIFKQTGFYQGLEKLELKEKDPMLFERLFLKLSTLVHK